MKLQYQTRFGGPHSPPGERGNCWSACIASLLGLDATAVPNFVDLDIEGADEMEHAREANRRAAAWALEHGLRIVRMDAQWIDSWSHTLVIAIGRTKQDIYHCVLWQHGKCVHDPIPDGGGIECPEEFELWLIQDGERFRKMCAGDRHE